MRTALTAVLAALLPSAAYAQTQPLAASAPVVVDARGEQIGTVIEETGGTRTVKTTNGDVDLPAASFAPDGSNRYKVNVLAVDLKALIAAGTPR